MNREVFSVQLGRDGRWYVRHEGATGVYPFPNKADAVEFGTRWAKMNQPSQLFLDGEGQREEWNFE